MNPWSDGRSGSQAISACTSVMVIALRPRGLYQYADGTWAANGWYWLTEATGGTSGWYLFDAEGYMLTGYQRDPAGDSFLLCPEPGIHEGQCMVTDKRGACKIVGKYDFTAREYVY